MPNTSIEWKTELGIDAPNNLGIAVWYGDASRESPAINLRAFVLQNSDDDIWAKYSRLQTDDTAKLLYGDAEQGGSVWTVSAKVFDEVMGTTYDAYADDSDDDNTDDLHKYRNVVYIALEGSIIVVNGCALD